MNAACSLRRWSGRTRRATTCRTWPAGSSSRHHDGSFFHPVARRVQYHWFVGCTRRAWRLPQYFAELAPHVGSDCSQSPCNARPRGRATFLSNAERQRARAETMLRLPTFHVATWNSTSASPSSRRRRCDSQGVLPRRSCPARTRRRSLPGCAAGDEGLQNASVGLASAAQLFTERSKSVQLLSLNRGRAEPMEHAKASGVTGIYKRPVVAALRVDALGLAGDVICDTENHGGVDQALYLYGAPDYEWWSEQLGFELAPGTFGENLTLSELESAALLVGDRFHIGDVTIEVTSPRIPCVTLARRMGDPAFLKRFRAAERPGVYCRVIQGGTIQQGDAVRYERYDGTQGGRGDRAFPLLFQPHPRRSDDPSPPCGPYCDTRSGREGAAISHPSGEPGASVAPPSWIIPWQATSAHPTPR